MPFTHKGAIISARELSIGDDETISNLAALVKTDLQGFILVKHVRFAEYMIGHEVVSGDEPIPVVAENSPATDVQASYEAWRKLPRTFGTQWKAELERVENRPNG